MKEILPWKRLGSIVIDRTIPEIDSRKKWYSATWKRKKKKKKKSRTIDCKCTCEKSSVTELWRHLNRAKFFFIIFFLSLFEIEIDVTRSNFCDKLFFTFLFYFKLWIIYDNNWLFITVKHFFTFLNAKFEHIESYKTWHARRHKI